MRIATPHLVGEPVAPRDLDDFRSLFQDERVGVTMGGTRSDEEVALIVERDMHHWERHGFGHWSWRDATSGAFVGRGGLRTLALLGRVETEVGYAVVPGRWREGLATEMAAASVAHAFDAADLDALVCFTQPHNTGSLRVMEAVGFLYERDFTHAGLPHVLYRLRR